jgi:hypothetical protein
MKYGLSKWSLRNRLILATLALATVAIAASDFAASNSLRSFLINQADNQLNDVVQTSMLRLDRAGIESEISNEGEVQNGFRPLRPLGAVPTTTAVTLLDLEGNIVGQIGMAKNKYFNFTYNFQLQESNLRNDVNQLNTYINYQKVFLNNEFLLIRKTVTNQSKISQFSTNLGFSHKKWQYQLNFIQDLTQKRVIQRGFSIINNGCCVNFGFSIAESNQSNLIKPQRTFNLNIAFKNL